MTRGWRPLRDCPQAPTRLRPGMRPTARRRRASVSLMGRRRLPSLRSKLSKAWAAALAAGVWWGADAAWALGQAGVRIWLPEGVSSVAPAIDRLFYIILWITGVVFIAVEGTLLVFLVRYRQRPGRRAAYTHGKDRKSG